MPTTHVIATTKDIWGYDDDEDDDAIPPLVVLFTTQSYDDCGSESGYRIGASGGNLYSEVQSVYADNADEWSDRTHLGSVADAMDGPTFVNTYTYTSEGANENQIKTTYSFNDDGRLIGNSPDGEYFVLDMDLDTFDTTSVTRMSIETLLAQA